MDVHTHTQDSLTAAPQPPSQLAVPFHLGQLAAKDGQGEAEPLDRYRCKERHSPLPVLASTVATMAVAGTTGEAAAMSDRCVAHHMRGRQSKHPGHASGRDVSIASA